MERFKFWFETHLLSLAPRRGAPLGDLELHFSLSSCQGSWGNVSFWASEPSPICFDIELIRQEMSGLLAEIYIEVPCACVGEVMVWVIVCVCVCVCVSMHNVMAGYMGSIVGGVLWSIYMVYLVCMRCDMCV